MSPVTDVIAALRVFDLDDVGPEIGQDGGNTGAGDEVGEVEDLDTAEHLLCQLFHVLHSIQCD